MEWGWNPATVGTIATAVAAIGTLIVLWFIRQTAEDTRKGLELAEQQAKQTGEDTRKGLQLAEEHARIDLQAGRTTAGLNALSTLVTYSLNRAERGGPRESDYRTKANDYAVRLERFLESLPLDEDDEL